MIVLADNMAQLVKEIEAILSAKQALVSAGIITQAEHDEMKKTQMARIDAAAASPAEVVVVTPPVAPARPPAPTPSPVGIHPGVVKYVTPTSPDNPVAYYNALHEIMQEFIAGRSIIGNIEYGWIGLGGLHTLNSIYCSTSINNCEVMNADKPVYRAARQRCEALKARAKKIKSAPVRVLPTELGKVIGRGELNKILECKDATLQYLILEGKPAWVKKLTLSSHDRKLFGTAKMSEYSSFMTTGRRRIDTLIAFYRYIDRFIMYVADNDLVLGEVEPRHLLEAWDTIAEQWEEQQRIEYGARTGKKMDVRIAISDIMHKSGCTREEARICAYPPPKPPAAGTKANFIKYIQQFYGWLSGKDKQGDMRGFKYASYLVNPETGYIENKIAKMERPVGTAKREQQPPYALTIGVNKYLKTSEDVIIKIYERVLAAHDKIPKRYYRRPAEWKRFMRLRFILLRIIRESGARPVNVALLRWMDFPTGEEHPQIDWRYAEKNKQKGKNPPKKTYISHHLSEDIASYIRDYDPLPENRVVSGLSPKIAKTIAEIEVQESRISGSVSERQAINRLVESAYGRLEKSVSNQMIALSEYTCPNRVLSIRLRRSLFTLVWRCYQDSIPIEEFTGDDYKTVEKNYKEAGERLIRVDPSVLGKFDHTDMARKVFDKEYPTTKAVPEQYRKTISE